MTGCENCKQNLNEMRLSFYNDGIEAMKEGWIGLLPDEVFDSIVEKTFPNVVTIHYTYKNRCLCPACWNYSDIESEEVFDSDDDDVYCDGTGYNYQNNSANLCPKCFLEGIMRLYRTDGELPFMRCHSSLFFNKIPITVSPYEFQLPASYYVDYYRRKRPVMHKGKLYITNR
tara:strand:- start:521 stop:1036 length:516 start_codon:yes stop_codon:yes gene_type:complete